MKKITEFCELESRVVRSIQTQAWNAELEGHVRHCTSCAETVFATRALQALAQNTKGLAPEPNLMKILLQSYVRESGRKKRVQSIIFRTSLAICSIASSVGIALTTLYGPAFSNSMNAVGNVLSVSNPTFMTLPFCLLLVVLSIVWIMTESELLER